MLRINIDWCSLHTCLYFLMLLYIVGIHLFSMVPFIFLLLLLRSAVEILFLLIFQDVFTMISTSFDVLKNVIQFALYDRTKSVNLWTTSYWRGPHLLTRIYVSRTSGTAQLWSLFFFFSKKKKKRFLKLWFKRRTRAHTEGRFHFVIRTVQ